MNLSFLLSSEQKRTWNVSIETGFSSVSISLICFPKNSFAVFVIKEKHPKKCFLIRESIFRKLRFLSYPQFPQGTRAPAFYYSCFIYLVLRIAKTPGPLGLSATKYDVLIVKVRHFDRCDFLLKTTF